MKLQVSSDDIDVKQSTFNLKSMLVTNKDNNDSGEENRGLDQDNSKFLMKINFILRNKSIISTKKIDTENKLETL